MEADRRRKREKVEDALVSRLASAPVRFGTCKPVQSGRRDLRLLFGRRADGAGRV